MLSFSLNMRYRLSFSNNILLRHFHQNLAPLLPLPNTNSVFIPSQSVEGNGRPYCHVFCYSATCVLFSSFPGRKSLSFCNPIVDHFTVSVLHCHLQFHNLCKPFWLWIDSPSPVRYVFTAAASRQQKHIFTHAAIFAHWKSFLAVSSSRLIHFRPNSTLFLFPHWKFSILILPNFVSPLEGIFSCCFKSANSLPIIICLFCPSKAVLAAAKQKKTFIDW